MAPMTKIKVRPADASNWADFEKLFESRGSPHHCWCMVWRLKGEESKNADKVYRKNCMKELLARHIPVGLLAYMDHEPVAWCSVAPRETYRSLGGDELKKNIWSLVCFFIKREYRGMGLTIRLIEEAKKYARRNGAEYLEAYPVQPESHSYRFMGFVPVFEKTGFQFIKMTGSKRHVMIIEL